MKTVNNILLIYECLSFSKEDKGAPAALKSQRAPSNRRKIAEELTMTIRNSLGKHDSTEDYCVLIN